MFNRHAMLLPLYPGMCHACRGMLHSHVRDAKPKFIQDALVQNSVDLLTIIILIVIPVVVVVILAITVIICTRNRIV
jgi:hypothetical protein